MNRHMWDQRLLPLGAVSTYRDLIGLLEEVEACLRKADEMLVQYQNQWLIGE